MATPVNKSKRILLIAGFKAAGQTAPVENPQWRSTNEAAITLTEPTAEDRTRKGVAADVQSRWANGIDAGDSQIQVKADPIIGEGDQEIVGLLDMTCTSPLADTVNVETAGDEEDIPAA